MIFKYLKNWKNLFHAGGNLNTLVCLGIHNFSSYNIRHANINATETFGIGQGFEKLSGKSGQIISRWDSTASDLFFSGMWTSNGNTLYTYTIILADFMWHCDQVFVIVDGAMVSHW